MRFARVRAPPASPSARCTSSSAPRTGTTCAPPPPTCRCSARAACVEIRLPSGKPGTAGNAALVACSRRAIPTPCSCILAPRLDRDAQGADWVRAVEAHGAWVQVWPVDSTPTGRLAQGPLPQPAARGQTRRRSSCWRRAPRATCSRPTRSWRKLALLAPGAQMSAATRARPASPTARASMCSSSAEAVLAGRDDARAAHARRAARRGHGADARAVGADQGAARRLDARSRRRAADRRAWQRQSAALGQGAAPRAAAVVPATSRGAPAAPTA